MTYGRELLNEGALPRTATHTFTAEGYRWVNHENIAEIVFALGFDYLGVTGMLIAKCLLGRWHPVADVPGRQAARRPFANRLGDALAGRHEPQSVLPDASRSCSASCAAR